MERFESIDPEALYAPVLDLFPHPPCEAIDIGAGTGRDAAWLTKRGFRVAAVEPVQGFREAGLRLHRDCSIEWIDDRLPELVTLWRARHRFNLVLLSGVWQHLDEISRAKSIVPLASALAQYGRLVISLRQGPGTASRPVFDVEVDSTISMFEGAGLSLIRRRQTDSIQAENRAAGVRWTWLVFSAGPPSDREFAA